MIPKFSKTSLYPPQDHGQKYQLNSRYNQHKHWLKSNLWNIQFQWSQILFWRQVFMRFLLKSNCVEWNIEKWQDRLVELSPYVLKDCLSEFRDFDWKENVNWSQVPKVYQICDDEKESCQLEHYLESIRHWWNQVQKVTQKRYDSLRRRFSQNAIAGHFLCFLKEKNCYDKSR